jgi:hypothetical protein
MHRIAVQILRARWRELATTIGVAALVMVAGVLLQSYQPPTGSLHGMQGVIAPIAAHANGPHGNMFLAGVTATLGLACGLLVAVFRSQLRMIRAVRR